jgi:FixJ family two-component response regulator
LTIGQRVVAIVDDDPRVLEALENLLESAGYSVRTFSSATALLADSRLADIACLISDIGMPVMDGFELARQLRVSRPTLAIIFITGRYEPGDQRLAAAQGSSAVFQKPVNSRDLLRAVEEATRK